jgi:hypothetical protein
MNKMSIFKDAIIVLLIIIIGFLVFSLFDSKEVVKVPKELLHQIDSLKKENIILQNKLKSEDSTISNYKLQIEILDSMLVYNRMKIDTTNKKSHSTIIKIKGYKDNEVDSFFKDRYNY